MGMFYNNKKETTNRIVSTKMLHINTKRSPLRFVEWLNATFIHPYRGAALNKYRYKDTLTTLFEK